MSLHSSILFPKRNWLCGHCLVGLSLQLYDNQLTTWKNVAVIDFNEGRKTHTVKYWQDTFTLYLKEYRVRPSPNSSLTLENDMNRPTNNTVLEIREGVRCYRGPHTSDDVFCWNCHSQPQVVSSTILYVSFPNL